MSYSKQTWDTTSYVTPTRMNHIEDGIESVDTKTANDIDYVSGTTIKSKIDTIDNTISTISTTVTDVSTVVLTDLGDNYYAQKCGKLVTLFTGVITSVTATAQGWYLLKTLPHKKQNKTLLKIRITIINSLKKESKSNDLSFLGMRMVWF